jgi:hypothetical protein
VLSEKRLLQESLLPEETNARTAETIQRRIDAFLKQEAHLQDLIAKAQQDDSSTPAMPVADAESLDLAYEELSQLQQGPLELRIFYEVYTSIGRVEVDILRMGEARTELAPDQSDGLIPGPRPFFTP